MKVLISSFLIALLASVSVSAQTDATSAPETVTPQEQIAAPMAKHKKAHKARTHHAKKKHHKKKKHAQTT